MLLNILFQPVGGVYGVSQLSAACRQGGQAPLQGVSHRAATGGDLILKSMECPRLPANVKVDKLLLQVSWVL